MDSYRTLGFNPRLCQDALCKELEKLFEGKKFIGQEGRKSLKIFKQDLPIAEDDDRDVDTDRAAAPYVCVQLTDGAIKGLDQPQEINFSMVICAYDTSIQREGYDDVLNIMQDIVQRFCSAPFFGGCYTVLCDDFHTINYALQQDDTAPYYFSAVRICVSAPVMTMETEMNKLV